MFILVCFDIVDDRVRYRAVKVLKQFGVRVQKSVFECAQLTDRQFIQMVQKLAELIDHTQDTVRYYLLCRDCLRKVEFSGIGTGPQQDRFKVV